MLRIVIDDERTLKNADLHLRTSADALCWIKECVMQDNQVVGIAVDELYLDHDLGDDDSIRPVVDELERACFENVPYHIGTIFVHTANPVGADMIMRSRLLNQHYKLIRIGLERFVCA